MDFGGLKCSRAGSREPVESFRRGEQANGSGLSASGTDTLVGRDVLVQEFEVQVRAEERQAVAIQVKTRSQEPGRAGVENHSDVYERAQVHMRDDAHDGVVVVMPGI